MKLNLTKPLVVFDIESTGLVVGRDKIVELCLIKVMPDGLKQSTILSTIWNTRFIMIPVLPVAEPA